MIKSIIRYSVLFGFSLVISELILNLLYSQTIEMSKWYTNDIHQPDSTYGFVYKGNYDGWMRHDDAVFLKKLQLDSNGFRNTVTNKDINAKKVVLIGGYSMIFSYGMEDNETIAYHLQNNLKQPSTIFNTAWPGFTGEMNLDLYKKKLEPKISPELIIFSFYADKLVSFNKPYSDNYIGNNGNPENIKNLFRYNKNKVLAPPKKNAYFSNKTGHLYYKSLFVHKLSNKLDEVNSIKKEFLTNLNHISSDKKEIISIGSSKSKELLDSNEKYFNDYITSIKEYFEEKNQKVLFAFLPGNSSDKSYYDKLIKLMPQSYDYIDIHKQKFEDIHKVRFIANNHYSADHCKIIGNALADKLEQMLK